MNWLDIPGRPPRPFARAGQDAGHAKTHEDQHVVRRRTRLPRRSSPSRPSRAATGMMLDNTFIVWTNELGKGNSHTLDNIPFLLVGGAHLASRWAARAQAGEGRAQPPAPRPRASPWATASRPSAKPPSAAAGRWSWLRFCHRGGTAKSWVPFRRHPSHASEHEPPCPPNSVSVSGVPY